MSKTVDNRVVEMRFDNQNFESNVKTSMSTIDKLKQALKFDGVGKGFDNISSAAKNCNLNPLSAAVQTVGMKFSALQVMATTALANITNSAVNAGKQIVSALTIDPIKSGFQEYETKINAIQTVLANTESKGTTLGDVNAALDELNKYADKTIYNFTEMTKNIGTFTAAGVDLETSVSSIKGIANLAAISGSTSQQASTAMYQLSQALAAGRVSLMDWNSVVNAGMGGEVFQNALKRTARNMGIAVDEIIATYGSFRESLSREKWLTTDVLTETLSQIAGAYSEEDLLAKGYTSDQTAEILKLAKTGEEAATKVKTFTQLIDTTKEALQSGWTQSWENIIGDFEGAKTFWTGISDKLNNAIGSSADNRNNFLEKALDSNYDKLVKGLNEAGISTNDFQEKVKESAKALGYTDEQIAKITSDFGSFEAGVKSGAIAVSAVKDAVTKLTSESADLSLVKDELAKGRTGEDVRQIQKALKDLGYDLGEFGEQADGLDGKLGSFTETAIKAFQEANGLKVTGIVDEETLAALDKASTKTKTLKSDIIDLASAITEKGGRDLLHESLGNILNFVLTLNDTIGQAFREIFDFKPKGLFNAIKSFNDFTKSLKMSEDTIDEVKRSFKGLFAIIDIIGTLSGSVVKYAFKGLSSVLDGLNLDFLGFTAILGDNIVALRDWLDEHDIVGNVIEKIGSGIGSTISLIGTWIEKIKEIPAVSKALSAIGDAMSGSFGKLKEFFGEGGGIISDFISKLTSLQGFSLKGIIGTIKDFVLKIKDLFVNADFGFGSIKTAFENFKSVVEQHIPQLAQAFDWIIEKGKDLCEFLKGALPYAIGIAIAAMAALALMKIADVVQKLTAPFVFLQEVSESLGSIASAIKIRAIGDAIKSVILAVVMLGAVIALLAQMDQGAVWSSLGVIMVLIGGLSLLGYAMSKLSNGAINKIRKGAGLLAALAGSVLLAAISLKVMDGVDPLRALVNAEVLVGVVGALATISTLLGSNSKISEKGAASLIAIAGAMMLLVLVLKMLTKLNSHKLKIASESLSMIMGAFAVLIGVTKLISKKLKLTGLLKTLAPLILVVGGLATILTILSKLNVGNTKEISESISLLMLSFAASCAVISLAGGKAAAATGAIYALTGVVAGMAAILGYLDEMEITANLETVAGLSILLLSLSAACVILSAIGSAGGYALAGVGVLGVLILEIIGIFALLGKIEEWDPTVLENSIKSLSKIGSAIGEFFGSIVSSFGDAATRSLPDIGTRLSSFMRNIQPFLENAKNIPADIVVKVGLLSASIMALSGAEFVAAITNIASTFTGGGAFSNISSALNNLGDGMVGFYSKIEGVNKTALVIGTEAVKAFAGLMAVVPPEGGFLDFILGKKDLSSFAKGVSDFGDALAGFAEACSDLTDDSVAKMELGAKAGKALADLANAIPSTDGRLQKIIGYKDFEGFSESIEVFGKAMVSYAESISTLTEDDITKMEWMVDAGTALKDLATALPESGGWRQKILGDQDLAKFGTQIVAFGGYLMSYARSISDFTEDDADKIANTANASAKLADLVKSLPESGGWRQKILGDKDLATFGSSLSTFIVGLRSFLIQAREITDDDISAIPMVGDAIDAVQIVLEKVPKSGGWGSAIFGSANTYTFGTGLSAVAKGIKDFIAVAKTIDDSTPTTIAATSDSIDELVTIANSITENVDSGTLMSCVTQLSELGTLIVGLANQDYSGLTSLKDSLSAFGKDSLTSFIDAFTTGGTEAVTAVNTFLTMIETAFTAAEPNFEVAGKSLASSVETGLSDGAGNVETAAQQLGISAATALSGCSSNFVTAGVNCASGFAAGISANTFEAVAAATAMAEAALAAAEATLGINSPSKEFARDGKFSALGYVKGLESNLPNVYNAAYNVGETAKRGLGNAISKIQNLIESGIDTQPTIRPVLDISDVAAGVGSINGMLGINPSVSTLANVRRISSGMYKGQNGGTDDMASAIRELIDTVSNKPSNVYNIDGVTYDDGTNVSNAVKTLIRAAKIERRT